MNHSNPKILTGISRAREWLRFLIGLLIFAVLVGFFISGYSPPGIFGEVLRHNQAYEIDASPLFYSEVEHMAELERAVKELRAAAQAETDTGGNDGN